jgi:glycosyltransferase involved in cell wall biosynthesis
MVQHLNFANRDAFHRFALKNWIAAVNDGDFERAIGFDQLHYNELVKKFEDVAYWDRWQADTLDVRQSLTRCVERLVPARRPEAGGRNCFLVVHHNYSGLAHETQLARNMTWLRGHDVQIDIEIVYLFGDAQHRSAAATMYGLHAASIHFLHAENYQQAASSLAKLAEHRRAQGIIYPTIFFMAFWMSLFVPHANQKFIQMKYYPLHAGRIHRWAGGYRNTDKHYRINGCDFEQLPILDLQLAKRELAVVPEDSGSVNIGAISRPEKASNPNYIRFILDLLRTHPHLSYLYTGRPEAVGVLPESLRKHPRSKALGWVDPISAIAHFHIYLEPFPWGGGEMTLLALEAGLPYLMLETEESIRFGIYGFIQGVAEGKDPILQTSFCKSPEQLRDRIAQLLENRELRQQLGQAWQQAIKSYKPPTLKSWHSLFND